MMSVDENLMCSFQILEPANKLGGLYTNSGNTRGITPPNDKRIWGNNIIISIILFIIHI